MKLRKMHLAGLSLKKKTKKTQNAERARTSTLETHAMDEETETSSQQNAEEEFTAGKK